MQGMVTLTMGTPNTRLRAVRMAMRMSQSELAHAIRQAGERAGEPNGCTASQIRRWESGATSAPQGRSLRALEMATGQPAENLGFATEQYGADAGAFGIPGEGTWLPEDEPKPGTAPPLNGIWRSQYEYESTGRAGIFSNAHYVIAIQHGAKLQIRSLPGTSPGRLLMELTINGAVLTGTWTEETNPGGYYQGATYSGGIQMLLEPSSRKMTGKWVGFGRDFDMNTGPWSLELVSSSTGTAALEAYNRPPGDRTPDGDLRDT
jgi:transcriptional regulator with XRE-family HTH domain